MTRSTILPGPSDYADALVQKRAAIARCEQDLMRLREERNLLIFKACKAGLTERSAAKSADVSYGYAGRCHRTEGNPGPGK